MDLLISIPEDRYKDVIEARKHHLLDSYAQAVANGIPLDKIRDEIERLHYHPKLDFIKNDEVVEMALDIIDKYREEQTDAT